MTKLFLFCVLVFPHILLAQGAHAPKSDGEMANAFVAAMRCGDPNSVIALAPKADVFRITAPEETKGKSDEEIMELAKPMTDKLIEDYNVMRAAAAKKKIEWDKIIIKNLKISGIKYAPQGFYGMEVAFTYKKKKGTFVFGIAIINDIYYLYEIENAATVFKKI
jgi:hypothetical protein